MIDPGHNLSRKRQAEILGLSRNGLYYRPVTVSAADLAVMRRLDALHLDYPFAGSRMLRDLLRAEGVEIGRCHVATLMRRLGIEAIYRRPRTTKPAPGHKIYPYLLRDLLIDRPDQVWGMDITTIPMARGGCLSRCGPGLVQPARALLAGVDHDGSRFLSGGGGGSGGDARQAPDIQH